MLVLSFLKLKNQTLKTCTVKPVLRGQRKSGLLRQVTSKKRFNLYEIFYERTRKMLPFNTGDYCSINKWADIL